MITLPRETKEDLERQSLETLASIRDEIVVIGGWAARAWGGKKHRRFTFDIDGVASEENLRRVRNRLADMGLRAHPTGWGIKLSKPYSSASGIPAPPGDMGIQIKIELSPPRIHEDPDHYFEFDLGRTCDKVVWGLDEKAKLEIKTPEVEYLVANKLGIPSDYRSQYDVAALLPLCDERRVVDLIKNTDRWSELVLKRVLKTAERIRNPTTEVHDALSDVGVDTQSVGDTLARIAGRL